MNTQSRLLLVSALTSTMLLATPVAMADIFLKIDDPDTVGEITGNADTEGYRGQLVIENFSQYLGAPRENGYSDTTFDFLWNASLAPISPKLFDAVLNGKPIKKMVVTFVTPNNPHGGMVRRQEIVLEDVAIVGHSGSFSTNDAAHAQFSVQPAKTSWTTWSVNEQGEPVSPVTATWVKPEPKS
jgi:type VI protein secretion system component Hcp